MRGFCPVGISRTTSNGNAELESAAISSFRLMVCLHRTFSVVQSWKNAATSFFVWPVMRFLVRLKVGIIVATPSPSAAAAKNATGTIPIVMIGAGDPVGQGLIASLSRPGSNVTGLSYGVGQEIFGKQLALLKEAVPKVGRVAVLWNPAVPTLAPAIREVKVAARSLGVQLQLLEARGPHDFDGAFAAMVKERVQALLVLVDPMFSFHRTRLADLAAKSRLPAAYTNRLPVEAGGLMSYGPSLRDLWRRSATFCSSPSWTQLTSNAVPP